MNAKTMVVFGETGCGKSTFLNSIANYILGVELEDNFRYLIIAEDTRSQKGSITSVITDYYLKDKLTNTVYRLIDTPGLGDTRGFEKDEQIVEMVRQKFKKDLETVHNVLFVIKSSTYKSIIHSFNSLFFHLSFIFFQFYSVNLIIK